MNKHLIAFLSVFSLGLVLSVYYVMIPKGHGSEVTGPGSVEVIESDELYFAALKEDRETGHQAAIREYQEIVTAKDKTAAEKAEALQSIEQENVLYALEMTLDQNVEDLGYPLAYTRIEDFKVTLIVFADDDEKIDEPGIIYLVLSKLGDHRYDIGLTVRP